MSYPLPLRNRRRACDFQLRERIGEGALAEVYVGIEWDTGISFALKMFERTHLSREKKDPDVVMEEHCLRRCNHPCVIKLHSSFRDDCYHYLVLELCLGGELWNVVKDTGCPEPLARHYLSQLCSAMNYLRDAEIVHRDLKAENVLISTDGNTAKLIDFGTAKDLANRHIKGSGTKSFKKVLHEYVGTPNFMAPEVIRNKASDFKSDLWSLGCTIFQVLSGLPPFFGGSQYRVYKKAVKGSLDMVPGISTTATDLIGKLIVVSPESRLGARDFRLLQAHPFFHGLSFDAAPKRRRPLLSLEDICLLHVGKRWSVLGQKALALADSEVGRKGLREYSRDAFARFDDVATRNAGRGGDKSTSISSAEEDKDENGDDKWKERG